MFHTAVLALTCLVAGPKMHAEGQDFLQQSQAEKASGGELAARTILRVRCSPRGNGPKTKRRFVTRRSWLHAANGKGVEASKGLASVLAKATRLGCGRCRFEARLALAEVEMRQGKRLAARERFAALEKDAASKGFLLVAHQTHAGASK
jgi:hypothetical protein